MECLTVRELVREAGLGLVLMTGESGLENVIEGIHLSDLRDPTPWMTSGMVLITTGASFASLPEIGLELLDRLKASGAVALGVGVGHYLEHVPQPMIDRAHTLRIPIFEAPLSVPFRIIVAYVYDALASSDMHRLRRSLAVQSQLLDILIGEHEDADLIAGLSSVLEIPIVLFDAQGDVVVPARVGVHREALASRLWEEYERVGGAIGPLGVLESGHYRFHYHKVCLHGVVERVLAAAAPQAPHSELTEATLSFVHRLLALDLLRAHERNLVRRRIRSQLLEDFLSERGTSDELLRRMDEQDVDIARRWRLVLLRVDAAERAEAGVRAEFGKSAFKNLLLDAIDEQLGSLSLSCLSALQEDTAMVLVVVDDIDHDAVMEMLRGLRQRLETALAVRVAVGCSAAAEGLVRPRAFLNQCYETLREASTRTTEAVCLFEDLPGALRLLNGFDPEAVGAAYGRLIVPLLRHDAQHHTYLVSTLRALFANHLSSHETAASLFIHRNTLQKRLRRIESLIDVDLDSMDDVLELYMAMGAGELHPELSSG